MKLVKTEEFFKRSSDTLAALLKELESKPTIDSKALIGNTALIVVDMNEGFATKGALYSPRIEALKPEIARLAAAFDNNKDIPVLIVNDEHPKDSLEFKIYPQHCVKDTEESRIIQELCQVRNSIIFPKSSTNGFVSEEFREFIIKLKAKGIRNFVIVGDCTDICIYQLATTMKAHFNHLNEEVQIIVPINAVDTFDLEVTNHNGDLMNVVFLYSMMGNGISVVREII
ncbi:MAG: isochorismatase family cysteine hydrolase [Bacillota bacterium]|nr:isochorismatase family cysteine hydrolase [Bacillota bacterium]